MFSGAKNIGEEHYFCICEKKSYQIFFRSCKKNTHQERAFFRLCEKIYIHIFRICELLDYDYFAHAKEYLYFFQKEKGKSCVLMIWCVLVMCVGGRLSDRSDRGCVTFFTSCGVAALASIWCRRLLVSPRPGAKNIGEEHYFAFAKKCPQIFLHLRISTHQERVHCFDCAKKYFTSYFLHM